MSAVTTFVTKHTRHATPVIIAAAVFVGGSYIKAYSDAEDLLDSIPHPTEWQQRKPRVIGISSALIALGALVNQAVGNRRKKLEGDNGTAPPTLSEEEFFRRRAGPQPPPQPPK